MWVCYTYPAKRKGERPLNILESLFRSVTRPEQPLHAGEAFTLWAYYEAAAETRAILLVLLNHTEDKGLKELMEHFIDDVLEPQVKQAKDKLLEEGIILPEVSPDHPKVEAKLVPVGARFTDEQICNMIVVKVQGLLQFCHEGIARSLRDELGVMFYTFQSHILAQGASMKGLMTQRGWLRVPPTFVASPAPQ